ncbi:ABC transporter permease [Streptomyces sp. NBC_00878]|uniref:ABC transporter permease n=1 Tax=Streptomyces sp. NBC_00878 TaxID=2975854 RepID=UPI0022542EBB|nr:ABC transporter permease [Streptomyces sp. NBC_00878]MCX4905330.1 ABC transporter permease [Streptomyces sp. NBC_00878]
MSTPQHQMQQPAAPAPNWQGAPGTSYTSPIPVTRTHLGHALASEWTKIKSVRSTMWTLGAFLLLVVGIGFLVAAHLTETGYDDSPYTLPAFSGLLLGQLCLITLGVLVISSEYGTGMIRATFTASPQRHRVLTAKLLIFFVVAFVVSALAIGVVGLITSGMDGGTSDTPWGGTVLMGALYVSLLGVLALAVGSMLRHSAGAITAMLGVVLVPAVLPLMPKKMMEYNAPNALAQIFHLDSEGGNGGPQLVFLAVVTAAAIAGAYVLLEKRDV